MPSDPRRRWPPALRGPDGPARLAIFARDGNRCAIGMEGCTVTPTDLDHIIPLSLGGEPFDPTNLRAACSHCNSARSNPQSRHQRRERQRPSRDW